jgi:hypothetical protein
MLILSRWSPPLDRVLIVESGSRTAADRYIAHLYQNEPITKLDVLTCYNAGPLSFNPSKGELYYTHHAASSSGRAQLFKTLATSGYSAVCILCTGDPIMTKWKWMAALRIPAKIMIVNENADSFWLDRGYHRDLWHMIDERLGLSQLALLRIVYQIVALPFTLAVLLSFAAWAHGRRLLRTR